MESRSVRAGSSKSWEARTTRGLTKDVSSVKFCSDILIVAALRNDSVLENSSSDIIEVFKFSLGTFGLSGEIHLIGAEVSTGG